MSRIAVSLSVALAGMAVAAEAPSVETLAGQLGTADLSGRRDAAHRLLLLGTKAKAALPALIKALDDPDKQVWSDAVSTIAAIGPDAAAAIPDLLDDMDSRKSRGQRNHDKSQTRFRSAYALSCIGPAAIPVLVDALNSEDRPLRAGAARALGSMRSIESPANAVIPALLSNLGHPDTEVNQEVIQALGAIGAPARTPLLDALVSPEPAKRSAAALALGAMGKSPDAARALQQRLTGETEVSVRESLYTALGKVGVDAEVLIPRFMDGLREGDERVRHAAINGLLSIHQARKQVVEAVGSMLRDADPAIRQRAAYVLGRLGDAAAPAVPALVEHIAKLSPTDPVFTDALVQIGDAAVPGILDSLQGVEIERVTTAHWAVKCLQSMGSPAVKAVQDGLSKTDPAMRLASVRALGLIGADADAAVPSLLGKLDDPEPVIRAAALEALLAVKGPDKAMAARIGKALVDESPVVRLAAVHLVSRLGDSGKELHSTVTDKLQDANPEVAGAAADTLQKLNTQQ